MSKTPHKIGLMNVKQILNYDENTNSLSIKRASKIHCIKRASNDDEKTNQAHNIGELVVFPLDILFDKIHMIDLSADKVESINIIFVEAEVCSISKDQVVLKIDLQVFTLTARLTMEEYVQVVALKSNWVRPPNGYTLVNSSLRSSTDQNASRQYLKVIKLFDLSPRCSSFKRKISNKKALSDNTKLGPVLKDKIIVKRVVSPLLGQTSKGVVTTVSDILTTTNTQVANDASHEHCAPSPVSKRPSHELDPWGRLKVGQVVYVRLQLLHTTEHIASMAECRHLVAMNSTVCAVVTTRKSICNSVCLRIDSMACAITVDPEHSSCVLSASQFQHLSAQSPSLRVAHMSDAYLLGLKERDPAAYELMRRDFLGASHCSPVDTLTAITITKRVPAANVASNTAANVATVKQPLSPTSITQRTRVVKLSPFDALKVAAQVVFRVEALFSAEQLSLLSPERREAILECTVAGMVTHMGASQLLVSVSAVGCVMRFSKQLCDRLVSPASVARVDRDRHWSAEYLEDLRVQCHPSFFKLQEMFLGADICQRVVCDSAAKSVQRKGAIRNGLNTYAGLQSIEQQQPEQLVEGKVSGVKRKADKGTEWDAC